MSTNSSTNEPVATMLSACAGTPGTPRTLAAYQMEPKSTPRSELNE